MRTIFVLAVLVFVLSSCIDKRPFSVGSDIDASWQIRYAKTLDKQFLKVAKKMCGIVKNSKVGVVDFVDLNSDIVDENGRYLAYLLSKDLEGSCPCMAYYLGLPNWFNYKTMELNNYPTDRYEFAVLGTYKYDDGCYDVFIRVVDLKEGVLFKTYGFVVSNKKVRFGIEPLHIPDYVEYP